MIRRGKFPPQQRVALARVAWPRQITYRGPHYGDQQPREYSAPASLPAPETWWPWADPRLFRRALHRVVRCHA